MADMTGFYKALEAPLDKRRPGIGAGVIAFNIWCQPDVREGDFGAINFARNVEGDRGSGPLVLVVEKAYLAFKHPPSDTSAGDKFRYLLLGIVQVPVTVREDVAEPVAFAFELTTPPRLRVYDMSEDVFRCLIRRECRREILFGHDAFLWLRQT